jgi:hypothetical protein
MSRRDCGAVELLSALSTSAISLYTSRENQALTWIGTTPTSGTWPRIRVGTVGSVEPGFLVRWEFCRKAELHTARGGNRPPQPMRDRVLASRFRRGGSAAFRGSGKQGVAAGLDLGHVVG